MAGLSNLPVETRPAMMGTKARVFASHPAICLEQLVPSDDFYRHLDATLDLGFVRHWVVDEYANTGRPSVDPVVFFKLQLVLFFEGLRSERQLMRVVADRLSLRWYLGYDFGEPLPDHSSLTRIRERYGVEAFRRFFERIVELCQDAGLVWGKELIFDATKVQANAALDSLVPRFYLKELKEKAKGSPSDVAAPDVAAHVDALFGNDYAAEPTATELPDGGSPALPSSGAADAGAGDPATTSSGPTPLPTGLSATEQAELAAANAAGWRLLEPGDLDPERPPHLGYQRIAGLRVNPVDPDATPMQLKGGGTKLGYQDHYVVDGGKHRIILAALVLPGDIRENLPLADLTRRVCFRWHLRPQRAIADTAYGTGENLRLLEEELGIRAYMPVVDGEKPGPLFKHADFTYDRERDVYVCPQGTILRPQGRDYDRQVRTYRSPVGACAPCPVRDRCTKSSHGRALRRHFDEGIREQVRAYQGTEAYKRAMRKREVWIEPLFGEAKDWHGLRRFRLRGIEKVNIEGLRIATGQNLKRYLAASGWGRRLGPAGSLTARPNPVRSIDQTCD
jgi:transposase